MMKGGYVNDRWLDEWVEGEIQIYTYMYDYVLMCLSFVHVHASVIPSHVYFDLYDRFDICPMRARARVCVCATQLRQLCERQLEERGWTQGGVQTGKNEIVKKTHSPLLLFGDVLKHDINTDIDDRVLEKENKIDLVHQIFEYVLKKQSLDLLLHKVSYFCTNINIRI